MRACMLEVVCARMYPGELFQDLKLLIYLCSAAAGRVLSGSSWSSPDYMSSTQTL